jgi:dTDP-4-amino-4,6-dideoxygalactose transaminase
MISISKPFIGESEKKAVLEVLDSGFLVQGPRTAKFEERFAQMCGVKHAIAVTSGTSALYVAMLAHGIGPGDEVITTAFTFAATANAILFAGAKPVFVDIEDETFNIDPALVEQAITPQTRAIMPIHLYGHVSDMQSLQAIADQHGLPIIEDACQAVLATYDGKFAGSFGTGTFSFYATKNMMTGEGGMITTNDNAIAQQCRLLRNHGMTRRYYHDALGFNYRMTDLQAAIGLAQIERLPAFTEKRRANAAYLNANLHSVVTPTEKQGYGHVWHQYTVRVRPGCDRDSAVKQLNDAGVGTGIYYPVPLHHQDYLKDIVGGISLPVTEKMAKEVISLPVHPALSAEELETIASEVNKL